MDELLSSSTFAKLRQAPVGAWIVVHRLIVIIACVGLVFFGYGLLQYFSQPSSDPITIQTSAQNQSVSSQKPLGKSIVVDIEGAIIKPGVYTLSADARVQDGLIAAGGLSSDADRKGIAKLFNMAAKLTDGGKLYFPFQGEVSNAVSSAGSAGQVAGASTSVININTASEAELDSLPGIGAVTAQKIISNRPYQTVDELTGKKVVSASVFSKIKDLVTAN